MKTQEYEQARDWQEREQKEKEVQDSHRYSNRFQCNNCPLTIDVQPFNSVNAYSITVTSPTSSFKASKHYNIPNTKTWKSNSSVRNTRERTSDYKSSAITMFNSKEKELTSVKIEDFNLENVGVIADFGSESEDEHECDRKIIERENTEIMNFVKSHPMPSPNDDNECCETITKYVRFDIIRKMYENLVGRDITIQLEQRRRDEHNVDKSLQICWKEQSNN